MTRLSTPIAYIANALLPDPFPSKYTVEGSGGDIYGYLNITEDDYLANAVISATTLTEAEQDQLYSLAWMLTSQGPDRVSRVQELAVDPEDPEPAAYIALLNELGAGNPAIYDPTNGTVSSGDILRTGKGIFEPRHVGL